MSAAAPLTDEELERRLREREKEEERAAREAAAKLAPGTCPTGCGGMLAERPLPFPGVGLFLSRRALHCKKCGLDVGARPSEVGQALGYALAGLLLWQGMSAIFAAQRVTEGRWQVAVFLIGALLFGGGMFVAHGIHGLVNPRPAAQEILKRRRRRRAEQAPSAEGEKLPDAGAGWFQENLEAVVVAIILALVIRHFVMEAFVIPTGSMAPTLFGDHFRVTCPNCGNEFALAKAEHELVREATIEASASCPLCDHEFDEVLSRGDVYGGHKILVNKFAYDLRPPRRYEVIVFKFPEKPWRNYIKRLVGLPGDTLAVRNGDLWANGSLAKKPDDVQDAVWIPVHDAAHRRGEGGRGRAWWAPLGDPAPWSGDLFDGSRMVCEPGAEGTRWAVYTRTIRDSYGYNRADGFGGRDGHNVVGDLRARARVTGAAGAVVRLAVCESEQGGPEDGAGGANLRVVAGRFEVGEGLGEVALEVDGQVVARAEAPRLRPEQGAELTLAYADDRARLLVDGREVLAWDDPFGPPRTERSEVRLGAEGGKVVFERTRIDRDIYYVASHHLDTDPSKNDVVVPPGHYFVMGDNSPNSEDGRAWGFVSEGHMIGRSFLVFWPLTDVKLIR